MTGFGSWFDDVDADERAEQEEKLDALRETYAKYERPLARAFRDASRRAMPVTHLGDPDPNEFVEARIQRLIKELRDFAANPDRPARHDEDPRPPSEPRVRRERSDPDRTDQHTRVRVQPPGSKDEERPRKDPSSDRGRTGDSDSRPGRDDKQTATPTWKRALRRTFT